MNATGENAQQGSTSTGRVSWLRRIGWLGFFFFLAKGSVWLAIFLGAGALFGC